MNGLGGMADQSTEDLYDACAAARGRRQVALALAGAARPNTGLMAQGIAATRVYAETPDWNEQRAAGDTTFADSEGWADTLADGHRPERRRLLPARRRGRRLRRHHQRPLPGDVGRQLHPVGFGGRDRHGRAAGGRLQGAAVPGRRWRRPVHHRQLELHDLDQRRLGEEGCGRGVPGVAGDAGGAGDLLRGIRASCPSRRTRNSTSRTRSTRPSSTCSRRGRTPPLPNNIWPNPAVYDALGSGVQGLLTGQKTVDQVLADMDTAWDE